MYKNIQYAFELPASCFNQMQHVWKPKELETNNISSVKHIIFSLWI